MSESTTIRITWKSKDILNELAERSGESMMRTLERILEDYWRQTFLEETNKAYAHLRSDGQASDDFDSEIAEWDGTLMDGLDPNER